MPFVVATVVEQHTVPRPRRKATMHANTHSLPDTLNLSDQTGTSQVGKFGQQATFYDLRGLFRRAATFESSVKTFSVQQDILQDREEYEYMVRVRPSASAIDKVQHIWKTPVRHFTHPDAVSNSAARRAINAVLGSPNDAQWNLHLATIIKSMTHYRKCSTTTAGTLQRHVQQQGCAENPSWS